AHLREAWVVSLFGVLGVSIKQLTIAQHVSPHTRWRRVGVYNDSTALVSPCIAFRVARYVRQGACVVIGLRFRVFVVTVSCTPRDEVRAGVSTLDRPRPCVLFAGILLSMHYTIPQHTTPHKPHDTRPYTQLPLTHARHVVGAVIVCNGD